MNRSLGAFVLIASLATACTSTQDSGRFGSHFDGAVWTQGLERQKEDPTQWIPEATFGGLAAGLAFFDHDLSEDAPHHYITGGDTHSGDVLSLALGFSPLVLGGYDWAQGDQGESFEVAAEALLATGGATQALKKITGRHRPNGSGNTDSFPSGHVSFAAAGATLVAREIEARTGSRAGYFLFLPVLYVAIDRVEAERHFASDVAAGAALGMFFANWVYNAHYPDPEKARPSIFAARKKLAWGVAPTLIDERLALQISFAF